MAIKIIKAKKFKWYYLTDFSTPELEFLKKHFKFHALDFKDLAGEIQRSKIDIYKNYLFLVFQLPELEKDRKRISVNQIYFFLGKNHLVTISQEKIKVLNNLFYKIIGGKKIREEAFSKGSGYLLYKILDHLLRNNWSIYQYLEEEINRIERDIDETKGKKLVFDIAYLRRLILQFKAITDPKRLVINTLSKIKVNFIDQEMLVYFDDLDDFVEKNWFILERYQDRILSLHEINESLISYRTNKIMKILTIFSVALLPLTLLSGIYGMNISLPFANNPNIVGSFFGILSLIIIGLFLFLKKNDWI